jgi:NADH-quinone oxidoreductase subunit L
VLIGGAIGWALFRNGTALAPRPAGPLVTAARANLYGDAVNKVLFEVPGRWLTRALVYVDNKGVDGVVNGLAATVGGSSSRLRRLQTGFVRSYAMSMLVGAVLIVGAFVAVNYRWFS